MHMNIEEVYLNIYLNHAKGTGLETNLLIQIVWRISENTSLLLLSVENRVYLLILRKYDHQKRPLPFVLIPHTENVFFISCLFTGETIQRPRAREIELKCTNDLRWIYSEISRILWAVGRLVCLSWCQVSSNIELCMQSMYVSLLSGGKFHAALFPQ